MYELIGYYTGPEVRQSVMDRLKGRAGKAFYSLNPQLYKEGIPDPVRNFGVIDVEVTADETSNLASLEERLRREMRAALGGGIPIARIIVPPEQIAITLQLEVSQD